MLKMAYKNKSDLKDYNVMYSCPTAENEDCNGPALQQETDIDDEHFIKNFPALKHRSHSVVHPGEISDRHRQPPLTITEHPSEDSLRSNYRLLTEPTSTIPRFSRVSERHRKLNTLLIEAVKSHEVQDIERLIKAGASSNATCSKECISACQLAALRSDDALSILVNNGVEKMRPDRIGRTPLHIAAWAGNAKQVAILLGFPTDLQNQVIAETWSKETEEEIKSIRQEFKQFVNVKCEFPVGVTLPKDWKDSSIHHNCKDFEKVLPMVQSGWTPLHAASVRAEPRCVRLLLAAGADACARDLIGRTPLDIVGLCCSTDQTPIDPNNFAEVVSIFVNLNCFNFATKNGKSFGSPLHTAVSMESLEAVRILVEAKMPVNWLDRDGFTPLHLCVIKKLKEHLQVLVNTGKVYSSMDNIIEKRDKDSHTVLHKAILEGWKPGVCVALAAGASITAKDIAGDTSMHLAATKGDIEILNEILNVAKNQNVIDTVNELKETPLFKAIENGHAKCVKRFLEDGASIKVTRPWGINVFHQAAARGYTEVLRIVLDHDYTLTRAMINFLTINDRLGFGPIHFAVRGNHIKCVKLLLSRNAYCNLKSSHGFLKGSTPMHIAAINNHVEIAKILMKHDVETISTPDHFGWTPLHKASFHGSRDMIMLLLKNGADLSAATSGLNETSATAIDMIMNNLSKPTEFMEYVFDTFISINDFNLQDPNCKLTVDYAVLVPGSEGIEEIKVIKALVRTGDRHGQRRLLVHPLLESFLHLKWKMLWPFFYTILIFYGLFVMSLTMYVISAFYYVDIESTNPLILNSTAWTTILYFTIFLIISQEVLYLKVNRRYFLQLETWVKITSICSAVALPLVILNKTQSEDWARHVATIALLLSWLEMMFLLSRFPKWGYYVLMFGKVSSNVIRILLTFVFLLIGFSLSFMIQFRSSKPFESPLAALVKTMVMMTSEFDYKDLIEENKHKDSINPTNSILVVRLIFVIFVILAAIVLMNLIVGVAVHDLHNLQLLGNIMRLAKQVEFLESLEALVYKNRIFNKMLPAKIKYILKNKTISRITLRPSEPNAKCNKTLPKYLREAIYEKAQHRKKQLEEEIGSQCFREKIAEIHKATVIKKHRNSTNKAISNEDSNMKETLQDMGKQIFALNSNIACVKNKTKDSIKDIQYSIHELNSKMDMIMNKIDSIIKS